MGASATMEFLGVSTSQSSILGLFPRWSSALGIDAELVGRDLPLDAAPEDYRAALRGISADERVRGALVTTHKVGLYSAGHEQFDELDRYARLCGEVSCVSKRKGRLVGHAKDPVTAGRALSGMLAADHFARSDAPVLCLGAGGAGLAILVHLLERGDRPSRIVLADPDVARLDAARRVHGNCGGGDGGDVLLEPVQDASADVLLAALPPESLVINASGLGKDRPGSPVSDRAAFPERAVCWDLNYRGDLHFLRQAREQAAAAGLRVEDGWLYFLHGWAEHMAQVFGFELTGETFARLRAIADEWGGRRPGTETAESREPPASNPPGPRPPSTGGQ